MKTMAESSAAVQKEQFNRMGEIDSHFYVNSCLISKDFP